MALLADVVRTMYRYTNWANDRVFDTAAHLSSEQFLAPDDTPFGSIRNTLVHMILWQRRWLSWWDGTVPSFDEARMFNLDPDDYPDVQAVRAEWRGLHERTELFLSQLTDDILNLQYSARSSGGLDWSMPLWMLMMQVANHGTQHRSEVAMKLTGHGHSPGEIDLYYFALETGAPAIS